MYCLVCFVIFTCIILKRNSSVYINFLVCLDIGVMLLFLLFFILTFLDFLFSVNSIGYWHKLTSKVEKDIFFLIPDRMISKYRVWFSMTLFKKSSAFILPHAFSNCQLIFFLHLCLSYFAHLLRS